MNKQTQHRKILAYLRKHRELTTLEAAVKLKITKLPTRAGELKKRHPIYSRWRKEDGVRFKAYWLQRKVA